MGDPGRRTGGFLLLVQKTAGEFAAVEKPLAAVVFLGLCFDVLEDR